MTGRNVLIGLNLSDIEKKYKVKRDATLPTSRPTILWTQGGRISISQLMRKYPKTLFNKGVRAQNEDHVGHVMKDTNDRIVVFGEHD